MENPNERLFYIHVKNIPFRVRWQTIKDIARSVSPNVVHADIHTIEGDNGESRSNGTGWVSVKGWDAMQLVLERINASQLDGRRFYAVPGEAVRQDNGNIVVYPARPVQRPPMVYQQSSMPPMQQRSVMQYAAYPPEMNFAVEEPTSPLLIPNLSDIIASESARVGLNMREGVYLTQTCGVFVNGLPYEATRQDLYAYFSTAGQVYAVDLPMNPTQRDTNKGWATITYGSLEGATLAVERFDQKKLGRRRITVRLDRDQSVSSVSGSRRQSISRQSDYSTRATSEAGYEYAAEAGPSQAAAVVNPHQPAEPVVTPEDTAPAQRRAATGPGPGTRPRKSSRADSDVESGEVCEPESD